MPLLFLAAVHFISANLAAQNVSKTLLFIGTYTEGRPDTGIYIYDFNPVSGQLRRLASGENLINPSYLSVSPNGRYLYACTESKLPRHGSITAFQIDSTNGKINFINHQDCGGENPVYLTVDKHNRYLIAGNYTEGNVAAFPLGRDGSVLPLPQIIQFNGSGLNYFRQEKAHIHATVFSPNSDFIYFPDLGADKIRAFQFTADETRPLTEKQEYTVKTPRGGGPRHFVFHPNGKTAYCIEELSGTVGVYSYKNGKLDSLQRIFSYSKRQKDYGSSDIHISPDGSFLYAANRWENENTISIFSIDPNTGRLMLVGHQPTFGDHPRMFVIDPTGNFLLVANLVR